MSSNTNSNNNSNSASILSITSDWMTVPDAQLNWDDNDMDETAAMKFQEKCWCKKAQEEEECKHLEEEDHHKAEERHKAEEEARACAATEEKKKCEEAAVKECTKNNLPCKVVMGLKKRSACMGCTKLKEKCEWPVVEIAGGGSKQVTLLQGGEKKKRARKSTMVDDRVVVEGWEMGQLKARGSGAMAEAICKLMRELTGQLDMFTDCILKELQGQSDALESLVKTQQNIGWNMTWHYSILEDMLGELEVFAANPGEPPEEEDMVE
ncbi:hypothetical protein ID866_13199, partial [Astraeus odoratus]